MASQFESHIKGPAHEITRSGEGQSAMSNPDHARCRECRALNEPGALFCSRCGASLAGPPYLGGQPRRRRVTAAGAAMGFALFLILLATAFTLGVIVYRTVKPGDNVDTLTSVPGTIASTSTTLAEGSSGNGASTSSTVAATLVRPRAASASSVLKATSTINYGATNLLDGDLATAWNEGVEGPGTGQWVRFAFSEPVILARIEIANGYQKDPERFKGNARVKSLKLEYSNGTTQLIDLLDTEDYQSVTTVRKSTEWIKLTIVSVYPDYIWEDAALSEVRIFAVADQQ